MTLSLANVILLGTSLKIEFLSHYWSISFFEFSLLNMKFYLEAYIRIIG
jgi:hypothetical protein